MGAQRSLEETALFEVAGLCKSYPGVIANDEVSFSIARGSLHALIGENGAGKSTLVKMIYGLVAPNSGSMRFGGADYRPKNPREARARGIGMVFQHFSLFEALSVADNIALGMERPPTRRKLEKEISEISESYGFPVDPKRHVGSLSAGEQQRVELVRCLLQEPDLLILDEPTSVLTPGEVETLFTSLRQMKEKGISVLFISHKLEEVRALCDRATILRRGRIVGECIPADTQAGDLARMMLGQELASPLPRAGEQGASVLRVENARPAAGLGAELAAPISLELHEGEILGVAGIAGNGQDMLFSILSGEEGLGEGAVIFEGRDISRSSIDARRKAGIRFAPEERLGHAAIGEFGLFENAALTARKSGRVARGGIMSWRAARGEAKRIIEDFDVRTSGPLAAAGSLSGGNLQKFVIGREIGHDAKVLVINQPSWGVDAAAAALIRRKLRALAGAGKALLVISQDIDELFELSDRIAVLAGGRLSAPQATRALDMEAISALMAGEF